MSRRLGTPVRLAAAAVGLGPGRLGPSARVGWPSETQSRRVRAELTAHLASLGIAAEALRVPGGRMRGREHRDRLTVLQMADIRGGLGRITSFEVWRTTRKGKESSTVDDELTCVATLDAGLTLDRIPLLTNTDRLETPRREATFEWRGFTWGKLPLVADRLKADMALNDRLGRLFNTEIPGRLRIRAHAGGKVGITIPYDPARLPSKDALSCFERIVEHVNEYVAERNRARQEEALPWDRPKPDPTGQQEAGARRTPETD